MAADSEVLSAPVLVNALPPLLLLLLIPHRFVRDGAFLVVDLSQLAWISAEKTPLMWGVELRCQVPRIMLAGIPLSPTSLAFFLSTPSVAPPSFIALLIELY